METIKLTKLSIKPSSNNLVQNFLQNIITKNPHEPEFIQAVQEVGEDVIPFIEENQQYKKAKIFERICEPARVIQFRVTWINDNREIIVNRGFRVQMNSAIGPYKGGLRFHPSVNLSILKFLAFEQIFKNSLTTLPMGAGKGGSDFDPKGKSDTEVMSFCQSFMTELHKYIGPDQDIPAGDIGVGSREIGYLFGQYKKMNGWFAGVLTGKDIAYGGSLIRPEATGYGCVYFAEEMLKVKGDSLAGKNCVISGSGNVAQFTAEKLIELGAKVLTLSDSGGFIYDQDGINSDKLKWVMDLKNVKRGRISEYADKFDCEYYPNAKPWGVKCDFVFPCAVQNELSQDDAQLLIREGCIGVSEGANMPCTPGAINVFRKAGMLYGPGKAANAGGVAVSGLEMAQNSMRINWTREEVDRKLHEIMVNIHSKCVQFGKKGDKIDYAKGANIGGFVKVADAMLAHGLA